MFSLWCFDFFPSLQLAHFFTGLYEIGFETVVSVRVSRLWRMDAIHSHASVLHPNRLLLPEFNTIQTKTCHIFPQFVKNTCFLFPFSISYRASQLSEMTDAMAMAAPLPQLFFQFSKTPVPCASSLRMYPRASWEQEKEHPTHTHPTQSLIFCSYQIISLRVWVLNI